MENRPLESLPDDILLGIVEHLDTARDVANLASLSRRSHSLIHQDGWRTFVRTRFPSVQLPPYRKPKWRLLAERLTHQERCWEKRGFGVSVLREAKQPPEQRNARNAARGQPRRAPGSQTVSFHAVIDARLAPSLADEVVAIGVGENLLVQQRPLSGRKTAVWHNLEGKAWGYGPGTGDVTAASLTESQGHSGVVVGRANGDIQVLTARDDFSQTLQKLVPENGGEAQRGLDPTRRSPGQLAVSATQWEPEGNLLASCRGSLLALHDLKDDTAAELSPLVNFDFCQVSRLDEPALLRSVKFPSKDTLGFALGGSREPLRWGKLTPTGLEVFNAPSNRRPLDDAAALTDVRIGEKTTVRAIEPIRGGGSGGDLLLSAWDDGTYRLVDFRTPSAHDAVYRDRFQPYEAGSSLAVYGTSRFVAGSNTASDMRFFDFRYPKPYFHTTALPCSDESPFPRQRDGHETTVLGRRQQPHWPSSCCDHAHKRPCPWHAQSTWDYWRPDATLHLGDPSYDRIYCLAKASDTSDTLYAGLRGAVLDLKLQLAEDAAPQQRGRRGKKRATNPAPPGWSNARPDAKISLIETGVSLCQTEEWALESRGVPGLIVKQPRPVHYVDPPERKRHRLDTSFHQSGDFSIYAIENAMSRLKVEMSDLGYTT